MKNQTFTNSNPMTELNVKLQFALCDYRGMQIARKQNKARVKRCWALFVKQMGFILLLLDIVLLTNLNF